MIWFALDETGLYFFRVKGQGLEMTNRREFIRLGFAMTSLPVLLRASLGATGAGGAVRPEVPAIYKVIFEESSPAARSFAAAAARRGLRVHGIRGDITDLFYEDLDLRWKQGPVTLAGMTNDRSLFCIEMLARDRGMRLVHYTVPRGAAMTSAILEGHEPVRPIEIPLPRFVDESRPDDSNRMVLWRLAPRVGYRA
jgi:hypothetical protein